jgi:hypothetical protein
MTTPTAGTGNTIINASGRVSKGSQKTDKPQPAAEDSVGAALVADPRDPAAAGPSPIFPAASVGYTVGQSRMSQEFLRVEDRPEVAERLAAEGIAEGRGLEYPSSHPAYWMRNFEAYDIFEQKAPNGYVGEQRRGFDSVSIASLNLDLDHQSFHTNAWTVERNEALANNADAYYRRNTNPVHQASLNLYWDARADRLTEVREQLRALEAAAAAENAAISERLAATV